MFYKRDCKIIFFHGKDKNVVGGNNHRPFLKKEFIFVLSLQVRA